MAFPEPLKTLQTELIEARRRYEDVFKITADREVAALFLEMVELRMRAERQIREILGAAGLNDEPPSSFAAFVQRAVANVRATVVRTGPESLPAFVNDEAQILLAYNNAIDECKPYRAITDLLESQRMALIGMLAKMDHATFVEASPAGGPAVEPML